MIPEGKQNRARPDVLIYLSDQHNPAFMDLTGSGIVQTPNLRLLAERGSTFTAAYTSCPLCVPSRASMLACKLPGKTEVFTNGDEIAADEPTFLHSVSAAGYESVLCGRMHFIGNDQRHGFTKRIMGDFTPSYPGKQEEFGRDLGPFRGTVSMSNCLDLIGKGTSPVLEYDREVVAAACNYLEGDYELPQLLVVGTYGPHFPYVAPPDLYDYYAGEINMPASPPEAANHDHPLVALNRQTTRYCRERGGTISVDEDAIRRARTAYAGMVTEQDRHVGTVWRAWKSYLERTGRNGIFVYLSDHGDTAGDHGVFGKRTFFEGSVRIPLIVEGSGIPAGKEIEEPVSIMDLGPTVCDWVGAHQPPQIDGASLAPALEQGGTLAARNIISEYVERTNDDNPVPARMLRTGKWKLICYADDKESDLLFDLEADPSELHNLAAERPDVAAKLRETLVAGWRPETISSQVAERARKHKPIHDWAKFGPVDDPDRWPIPDRAREVPSE